jgi:prolyl oligopeptidase PreP (S9A serine peptidase family)
MLYKFHWYSQFPITYTRFNPFQPDNKTVFVYVESTKDFIFVDAMRQLYVKMNYPELQACIKPNEITYVCKETLPILTYTPNEDCEATLIHPSYNFPPKRFMWTQSSKFKPDLLDSFAHEQWMVVYFS